MDFLQSLSSKPAALHNMNWHFHLSPVTFTFPVSSGTISIGKVSSIASVGAGSSGKAALIITRFRGVSRSKSRTTALSRQSSAARLLTCKTKEEEI